MSGLLKVLRAKIQSVGADSGAVAPHNRVIGADGTAGGADSRQLEQTTGRSGEVEPTVGQLEQTTRRSGADSKASGSRQWSSWSRPRSKASGADSGAVGSDHRAIGCW